MRPQCSEMLRVRSRGGIAKLIFFLSFVPALMLIVLGIFYAIVGYDSYNVLGQFIRTVYGWEAFVEFVFWYGLCLCVIPVLPAMLLYQIIYLTVTAVRRRKAAHTET